MKEYKDYFKNRKEVEEYFKKDVFKFSFMCDNEMHFESLNPVLLDSELIVFTLSFYFESGNAFFAYSSFDDWFEKFQLSSVIATSEETHDHETMYFRKYVDIRDN